ncbi:transcriptional regulator, TetR family [Lutimaribacter pacificus]|uniref:Transcriptional regulator, TetR family n=1 Tax=Lutimaribacter pacificus TaxID=391948 RepID=A0A1H0L5H3_9RHOB|nr:TetR/AcrR family transcriptional regulator [Lutimaribacter pacificus]SDO63335.1 transcriptional regulator, TetR family [Lutimaribacter pacificus]SHK70786.1 transcriptional regulator, TetR family [Lutimaribacter pacificus]
METTRKKRRTQVERREEAESLLIAAATKLISIKGFSGFSLAEVGDLAGYSRGLAGHHFGTKENLQIRVAEYIFGETFNEMAALVGHKPRGIPFIEALLEYCVKAAETERAKALTMLLSEAQMNEKLYAIIMRFHQRALRNLEYEIQQGKVEGNIREDANSKMQAAIIYAFLRGQLNFIVFQPDFEYEEMSREFLRNLRTAIGT